MHMADALVSPVVGGVMIAASAGVMAYAAVTMKKDELGEKKIPIMGVAGAFVFAAQMINFTIPGTGSSGHIGGGILLAAMLGGSPAYIVMAAVLAIQAFFFGDGGLLALGANIWNMGFYTCFIAFPLIYKKILRKGINEKRIIAASVISVIAALQMGAFSVVLETMASGVTDLPFGIFAGLMQPIHLAIGAVEGAITAVVLIFIYKARPELLTSALTKKPMKGNLNIKRVIAILAVSAVALGGVFSLMASANPDGLEWSIERVIGQTEIAADGSVYESAAQVQGETAFLPDYTFKNANETNETAGTSVAGIVGGAITCAVAAGVGGCLYLWKRKRKGKEAEV